MHMDNPKNLKLTAKKKVKILKKKRSSIKFPKRKQFLMKQGH